MSDFSQKSQFEYLYDALAKQFPGIKSADGKGSLFQFVPTPIKAAWDLTNLASLYNIVNATPVNLDGFWLPGEAKIDDACQAYYPIIQPTLDLDLDQYRKCVAERDALAQKQRDIAAQAHSDYLNWKVMNTDSKGFVEDEPTWRGDPFGGKSWGVQIDDVSKEIKQVEDVLAELVIAAKSPVAAAIAAFDTDQISITQGGQQPGMVPRIGISSALSDDLGRWVHQDEYEFDVTINKDKEITTPWKTTVETKVSEQCWSTDTSVSVNTARIITDVHYQLRYTAVGISTYQIVRGKWFDGTYVKPGIPLVAGLTSTEDTFFGRTGSLHLIPIEILVMYKPNIELTVSTQCYKEQIEKHKNTRLGALNIFGFKLDVGTSGQIQPVTNPDNETVTIKFPSPVAPDPQIVGIISQVLYNGH